jgi:hypothetical protein
MSVEVMELFDIFSGTFGKEKAQIAVRDIEAISTNAKQDLPTKRDLSETELRLTKEIREIELKLTREVEKVRSEIEQAKSSTIKWVVGWMAGFILAQTAAILTILTLWK